MGPDSMIITALEESDGPSYAARAPVIRAGPVQEPQGESDVFEREEVERELLPADGQGFPRAAEKELPVNVNM
ncbi:hypothetical protein PInf_004996 [Phytophthora infestans]|nr:hypothetical protein PInf_004996 [Phytophthora infestans]